MSLRVVIRRGSEEVEGDVVIDARGPPQFYDVVILGGRELKSLIAIAPVEGGVTIGVGKFTKKPVAAVIDGRVVIRAEPLSLYIDKIESEISEVLRWSREGDEYRRLKELVISERRKYRHSPTLAALNKYLRGEVDKLPTHVLDIVGEMSREKLEKIFEKLVGEIY